MEWKTLILKTRWCFSYQTINFMMKRDSMMQERETEIQQSTIRFFNLGGELPSEVKRRERHHQIFEVAQLFMREQATWLGEPTVKRFNSHLIKDELEFQLARAMDQTRDNRNAAAHE
jgi:hypothetical protein